MDGAALTWEGDKMDRRPFERIKKFPIPSQAPGAVVAHCWHRPGLSPTNPFPAPHEEQPQQTQRGPDAASTPQAISYVKIDFFLSRVVRGHPLTKLRPKTWPVLIPVILIGNAGQIPRWCQLSELPEAYKGFIIWISYRLPQRL